MGQALYRNYQSQSVYQASSDKHPTSAGHLSAIRSYYRARSAIFGYRLLKGVNHFGYHPRPAHPLSLDDAQLEQNYLIGRVVGGRPCQEVLDCGCGDGSTANYITHKFGHHVTGVDILESNIRQARKASRNENNENVFLETNYLSLPLHNETFDAAYAVEAFVHAPNTQQLFDSLYRVLKPGGKLIFCEYTLARGKERSKATYETLAGLNTICPMPALSQFTHRKLHSLLAGAGFTNVAINDLTRHVLPSVKQLHSNIDYLIEAAERLGMDQQFIRMQRDYRLYGAFLGEKRILQYSLVTARKPLV